MKWPTSGLSIWEIVLRIVFALSKAVVLPDSLQIFVVRARFIIIVLMLPHALVEKRHCGGYRSEEETF